MCCRGFSSVVLPVLFVNLCDFFSFFLFGIDITARGGVYLGITFGNTFDVKSNNVQTVFKGRISNDFGSKKRAKF